MCLPYYRSEKEMGLADLLPKHKCGLFLTHNEHRDYYDKLDTWIKEREMEDCFESPEEMQKCIDTDELWELQWYPETPIGFHRICAPTLEDLLRLAMGDKEVGR